MKPRPAVTVLVREYRERDLAAWVALRNGVGRAPTSAEASRVADEAWDPERYHRARYVAEEPGGSLVGWGAVGHVPWQFHPARYALELEVAADRRRRGIGSGVLERILRHLRDRRALRVRARARANEPGSIGFLRHRGFDEVWRHIPSRLDLGAFDAGPFAGAGERVAAQGIRLTTLAAELERGPGVLADLYELAVTTNASQPQLDPATPPRLDEFVREVTAHPRAIPDACFLAFDRDRVVGLSSLERLPATSEAVEIGYTAVDPAFRRRGIALALKLRTIAWAREHGYRSMETASNAGNEPMIRLNTALGFRAEPEWITYELVLGGAGSDSASESRNG